MNPSAVRPAFAIEIADERRLHRTAAGRFILRPTGDGWSLMRLGGEVVFHGLGASGRRHCLEYARAQGALSVLS
jgi:hypothetical protein